jgi:adenosylhomocysteine nucleosidase
MMTASLAPTLLCAATKWEAEPIAKALGLFRCADGFAAGNVALIKTGVGAVRATGALRGIDKYEHVMSVGFCGALQPGMQTGDIVIDARGSAAEIPPMARETAAALGLTIHFGKIADSQSVVARPKDKKALGEKLRASAVDMESAAIAAWAENVGAEFLAIRVVLDGMDDRVPTTVPAGEGVASLLKYVRRHAHALPILAATGLRQRRAVAALSKFLAAFLPKL